MTSPQPPKKSDLPVRTASALVMIAVAGGALWLGGWVWTAFVAAVALGVLWEWWGLARRITRRVGSRLCILLGGCLYVGVGSLLLAQIGFVPAVGLLVLPLFLLPVIATDIGAYFAGRTFGGPKIAPRISPSKTWSGLAGGCLASGLVLAAYLIALWPHLEDLDVYVPSGMLAVVGVASGAFIAILAQAGDFFESWLKRRAGVKDSGNVIPGHGGLFDRVDGLLAVLFVAGLTGLIENAIVPHSQKPVVVENQKYIVGSHP